MAQSVIHCDPEILSGTPVFAGTRVPAKNLVDYLEGGHSPKPLCLRLLVVEFVLGLFHRPLQRLDVVQALRPEYLRTRGLRSMSATEPQGAVVYVDNVRRGGPESLRMLPRESVLEIRYLNGADATTMYGTNHGDGAILVRTRR